MGASSSVTHALGSLSDSWRLKSLEETFISSNNISTCSPPHQMEFATKSKAPITNGCQLKIEAASSPKIGGGASYMYLHPNCLKKLHIVIVPVENFQKTRMTDAMVLNQQQTLWFLS